VTAASLIVFCGPACSGKSTLAARLAGEIHAPHLEMDRTRARLMPESSHTRADREVAYRAMLFAAELLLQSGESVILDAPYGHSEDRRAIEEVVERTRARLFLVECRVSPELAAARLASRDPRHPGLLDLTPERARELARAFDYTAKGLLLDTGATAPEDALPLIRSYLETGRPLRPGEWSR
jgi:predicted kinase